MAVLSSIPRARRKEIADQYVAKTLKVALFVNLTGYNELTATTYAALVSGGATEVSASGTGYTTGGYTLSGLASAELATNSARVTATATTVASATFTCKYAVIYDSATGKIEGITGFDANNSDKVVTGGTITITWDNTSGLLNLA